MTSLASSLPAGLSPEPTPAQAGPAPGAGTACDSVPATCAGCRDGHWLIEGRHVRISDRGLEELGPCSAPPKPRELTPPALAAPKRSHEECVAKLRAYSDRGSAASVLAEARSTFTERSQPVEREPGEDDE